MDFAHKKEQFYCKDIIHYLLGVDQRELPEENAFLSSFLFCIKPERGLVFLYVLEKGSLGSKMFPYFVVHLYQENGIYG